MPSSSSRWSPCDNTPAGHGLVKVARPLEDALRLRHGLLLLRERVERLPRAPAPREHRYQHVLQHREARKDIHDLERSRQAFVYALVDRQARDRFALETDLARIGRTAPVTRLIEVVLPAPFGPMMAVSRPAGSVKLTPSTAANSPNRLLTSSILRSAVIVPSRDRRVALGRARHRL